MMNTNIYVASYTENGGIYWYMLTDEGKLKYIDNVILDMPMYIATDNKRLYVILRAPFEGKESGMVCFDIDKDGVLINKSRILSTKGEVACHICIDGENIYCTNYISGSVIKMPDTLVCHRGRGYNPDRQESPHTHYVCTSPDDKYVFVTDLGLDTIFVYDKALKLYSKARVPDGHGVRHLAISENGKYVFSANELMSSVTAFEYNDGRLKVLDTIALLPDSCIGKSTSAAIRVHNNKIFVSNRGHNTVSELSFCNDRLHLEKHILCGGKSPRDFNFIGKYMVCTNEESNNISVFDSSRGFLQTDNVDILSPVCVIGVI